MFAGSEHRTIIVETSPKPRNTLTKCPSGIDGLDEITGGGLPQGRTTLVCGSAGCGKTLFSLEFLVRGATDYNEPGVFLAFEETANDLAQNVASLGFDLEGLSEAGKLVVDHVHVERSEIEENGDYDLEGLFIRLGFAIDSIGAKRVVLDTLETLFSALTQEALLRSELRRLFRWLKDKGVTAIITAERGEGVLTRQGLEEYVSDCVILLDHRVQEQISTRRLRVVKYRGAFHGTNEYPFLIDEEGISVLPITTSGLTHPASEERFSTGIPRLDAMFGGKGLFRGSSVLISGTAGSGKSSLSASITDAACQRGEKCLYFAFEESPDQVVRNMRSIGIELKPWLKAGLLEIHSARPTIFGLEMHLAVMHRNIRKQRPAIVVVDPISNLLSIGSGGEVNSLLVRLIDFLKMNEITALFTSLAHGGESLEATDIAVSSIMDAWILLRDIELGGERNRAIYVLKSRGMSHSNQIREFLLTDSGIDLVDVYLGQEGVLTGSMRQAQEAREKSAVAVRHVEVQRKRAATARRRKALEAQIAVLQNEIESEEEAVATFESEEIRRDEQSYVNQTEMAKRRQADAATIRTGEIG